MRLKSKSIRYESDEDVRAALREISLYMGFLLVTTIVALSVRQLYMFYFNEAIEQLFLQRESSNDERKFDELVTINDWWNFLEHDFLVHFNDQQSNATSDEAAAGTENGNSSETSTQNSTSANSGSGAGGHIFLLENILLGPPRLRQIRVLPDTCHIDEAFQRYFHTCYAEYSRGIEDTSAEFKGTYFQSQSALNAMFLWGRVGTYVGGGYVKELTFNATANEAILEQLKANNWIDRGTRLVVVEFGLYNANTKLFDSVKFIAELPPIGGILTSSHVQALKLHSLWTGRDFFLMVVACIFYLFIIFYTIEEVQEIRKIGMWRYMHSAWNILDLSILICGYTSFAYNIWHTVYMHELLARVAEQPDRYQSLDVICFWNLLYIDMMAICAFCVCIKVFKYISFNKTMLQFSTTLRRCAKDLLGFGVMFLIVFLAYAQLGLLLFGTKDPDFRNFHESFLTMMRMVLGDFDYTALEEANRVLGPIYFLTYILLVFFILLNMFLAIINDTYSVVKAEIKHGRNHLQTYIANNLTSCCGWLRSKCGKTRPGNRGKSKDESAANATSRAKNNDDDDLGGPIEVVSYPAVASNSHSISTMPPSSTTVQTPNHMIGQPQKPVRLRKSSLLNEYFEEVQSPPRIDPEELKRLSYRMAIIEDLFEELIKNMDRILKKVDAKKRTKRD